MTTVHTVGAALILWGALAGAAGLWLASTIRGRDEQVPTSEERYADDAEEER